MPRPDLAGGTGEHSNGNGSLMRILPLAVFLKDKKIEDRFSIIKDVSSLTHAHIRSVLACFIYLEFALQIIDGKDKHEALQYIRDTIPAFCMSHKLAIKVGEYDISPIEKYSRTEISSSGYVVSTLEASLWCIMNSNSYTEAVLKAVNLGEDTDTTGCVTGGLAALIFGYESIPSEWIAKLARREDIKDLAHRLFEKYA
jgi:ADP-ribosylglycohydrolase